MAERGTEVENGWVRSTHFSSVRGAVVDGRSSHPRQPVRPLAVGLSHIFDPLVATYQAYHVDHDRQRQQRQDHHDGHRPSITAAKFPSFNGSLTGCEHHRSRPSGTLVVA